MNNITNGPAYMEALAAARKLSEENENATVVLWRDHDDDNNPHRIRYSLETTFDNMEACGLVESSWIIGLTNGNGR